MRIQFRLRHAFIVMTSVAIFSELFRWLSSGQSPFFEGLTCFGLGGIGGVFACVFVAMLGIMSARETINQRRAFIFAGICGLVVWILILVFGSKMPMTLVFSCAAVAVMVIAVRSELEVSELRSEPEVTLDRLKATKSNIRAEMDEAHNKREF